MTRSRLSWQLTTRNAGPERFRSRREYNFSAALTSNGVCRQAINLARLRGAIALSRAVYAEVAEVLARPKFNRVFTADGVASLRGVSVLSPTAFLNQFSSS